MLRTLMRLMPALVAVIAANWFTLPAARAQDELPIADSGQHVWFIAPAESASSDRRFELRHLTASALQYGYTRHHTISRLPEQMVAIADRLYLIYPAERVGEQRTRTVLSLRIVHNEPLDVYFTEPQGRLRLEPTLAGDGELIAAAGHAAGPTLLLAEPDARRVRPSSNADRDRAERDAAAPATSTSASLAQDTDDPAAAAAAAADALPTIPLHFDPGPLPALIQLQGSAWVRLELPADAAINRHARLLLLGAHDPALLLLTTTTTPGRTLIWRHIDAENWSRDEIDLDLAQVTRIIRLGDQAVLALATSTAEAPDQIELAYLRPTRTMRIALMDRPPPLWGIAALNDQLSVLHMKRVEAQLHVSTVDVQTGTISEPQPIALHRTGQMRVWVTSIIIAAAMSAILLFALLRPIPPVAVASERRFRLAPLSLRASALLIDLLPGALITMFVLRISPQQLFGVPFLLTDLFDATPFFIMVGLTLTHTTASEIASGRSIGKRLLGIRIVGQISDKVRPYEVILRNLGKGLSLAVPPLLILAVLNPNLQGLGDIMGRTLVVRPTPEEDDDAADDGGEGEEAEKSDEVAE